MMLSPAPQDASAPSTIATPLIPCAAASTSSAHACNSSGVGGRSALTRSRSSLSPRLASWLWSARPQVGSSGASRAMATALSAISLTARAEVSDPDTTAWRGPTSTRRPISVPSERSACSSFAFLTSTDTLCPELTNASAASAPAAVAASSNDSARSCQSRTGKPSWPERQLLHDHQLLLLLPSGTTNSRMRIQSRVPAVAAFARSAHSFRDSQDSAVPPASRMVRFSGCIDPAGVASASARRDTESRITPGDNRNRIVPDNRFPHREYVRR